MRESEEQLKEDIEELCRQAAASDRELIKVIVQLSLAQDTLQRLLYGETDRRVWLVSFSDSSVDFDPHHSEVGSLIRLHEIEEARDDALKVLDKSGGAKTKVPE